MSGSIQTAQTKYGAVSGVSQRGITRFMGIPYAAPPVGELRWRAPQRPAPWEGVRVCDRPGPCCPQRPGQVNNMTLDQHEQSEDCLYLNVWTPAHSTQDRLPVLVYIHGGAFLGGMGSAQLFEGWGFAARGVILVTINYRLGIFGFMAHKTLSAENADGVSGNYGLLDQIAALRWVKENIAAFGGDPNCVTLAGQSAGGMSVCALLTSPLASGLFRAAAIHSGGPHYNRETMTLQKAETVGETLMGLCGCTTLSQLRGVSAGQLLALGIPGDGPLPLRPCVDGHVLPEDPYQAFMNGRIAQVPLLFGSTSDEGSFVAVSGVSLQEQVLSIQTALGADFEEFARLYGLNEETLPDVLHDSGRDAMKQNLSHIAARLAQIHPAPVYQYLFAEPTVKSDGTNLGAGHSSELAYVFANLWVAGKYTFDYSQWTPAYRYENFELAQFMCSYWANFTRTGDPNAPGLPYWAPWVENKEYLYLKGGEVACLQDPEPAKMAFIDRIISQRESY